MVQLNDWQSAYSKLGEYIKQNPSIRITPNLVAIPGEVRTEFYRLFDAVRVAFLREKFPDLLAEAELLSKNYSAVSQEVTESLGITDIKLLGGLNWFLSDPANGLIRPLFDNLFNLVKSKIDTNDFEQLSLKSIRDSFNKLFKAGYEKWVIFSLLKAVAPDKLYAPDLADTRMVTQATGPETLPGLHEDLVPPPLDTQSLQLGHSDDVTFTVPDFIAHSTKLNRFFSLRSEIIDASWTAKTVSEKQEWLRLRTLTGLHIPIGGWPDMVIYAADKLDDLALVADFGRFCRPDVIIECVEQEGWYQQGWLERVKYYHDFLKPKLGTFVVSRVSVPEEAFKELEPKPIADEAAATERPETSELPVSEEGAEIRASKEKPAETVAGEALPAEEVVTEPLNIHILEVGYDQSLLAPIIEVFLTPE